MEKETTSITGKFTNTHQRSKTVDSSRSDKPCKTNVKTHEEPDVNEVNKESRWYLYLIENKLGQLYTGITTDPARRIAQHRGEKPGGAKALKGKSPLAFRAIFELNSKSDAAKLECHIKKLSRVQKDKIIQTGLLPLTSTEEPSPSSTLRAIRQVQHL